MRIHKILILVLVNWSVLPINAQFTYPDPKKLYSMPNACGITVNAGPDITICAGQGKQLNASVTGSTNYIWEPPDGLSNSNALKPTANPSTTTTYTLTAKATSSNLITNGGFETGNLAPSTSQYTPYTNVNNLITSTGGYMIMSVPQIAQAFGCTPSIGAFTLVITPTGSGSNIWCQTINVNPNTEYKIEYKVFGILYIFGSPPTIGLKINGNLIGTVDAISGLCLEAKGNFTWNSGASTTADICFANYGGQGPASMCSIDDIIVQECCEEKDEVTVTVYDLLADITPPDEINCLNRPITIDASGSSQGPGITYMWTTRDGKIISGDKSLNPVIDSPGIYTLKIMGEFGCESEAMVEVKGSVSPPDVTVRNTDIDCKNLTARIEASSKGIGVDFEWTGPNGYFSTKAINLNITEPGEYIVKVTDTYGCENSAKLEVKDNRSFIEAEISGDSLSCSKDSVQLEASSIAKKPKYNWTGPGGFRKDSATKVFVRDTGWYYLTTIDSSGCKELDSFYVKSSNQNIDVQISADTITCIQNTVQIRLSTDTTANIQWKGPNQFISDSISPFVTDEGWYYLDLLTKDGCSYKDSIYVFKDSNVPDIFVSSNDTITCIHKFINISGQTTTPGASYEWLTPQGNFPNVFDIQANIPGTYKFTVKGPNGCELSKDVLIYIDTTKPLLQLIPDTINCLKDSLVLNSQTSNVINYLWKGPQGFTSFQSNPIVRAGGMYTLIATGANGCVDSATIDILADTSKPLLQISSDTIDCLMTTVSPIVTDDGKTINYKWIGPSGFSSNQKNIDLQASGIYTLTVTSENGCTTSYAIAIQENLIKPYATLKADTITCKSSAKLRAENISANTKNLVWTGPLGFMSSDSISLLTNGGIYKLLLTADNGCTFEDSILVIQKDKIPDLLVKDDTLTCIKIKLNLSGKTQTQNVRYDWKGPNGFTSTLASPEIQDSGLYFLTITDSLGCENSGQINIYQFNQRFPVHIFSIRDTIDCNDSIALLRHTSPLPTGKLYWQIPDGTQISDDSLFVKSGGLYKIQFTNEFGCISEDSITIFDFKKLPDFSLLPDTLNCIKTNILLQMTSNDPDLEFNWTGPGTFKSILRNPPIQFGGLYQLTVKNTNGCMLTKSVNIHADTLKPDLSLSADTINCLRSTVPVKASSSLQGFNMIWKGPNGFNYTLPQFNTPNPGWYICTIINPRTGCRTTDSVQIVQDTQRIHALLANTQNANCLDVSGRIFIQQIIGGKAPYRFTLDNGMSYFTGNVSGNLTPGSYQLQVEDDNGCTFQVQTEIKKEDSLSISLPPIIELLENEKAQIILTILTNPGKIKSIFWNPSDQLDCNDCLSPSVTAEFDETIRVTVTDTNGCTAEASIDVRIKKVSRIWFPNVFSPNGDNINDFFYPIDFGSGTNMQSLSIYDRWGNRLYFNESFVSNNPEQGWNGLDRNGRKQSPGVYLYVAQYTENGQSLIISGDLTLIE
ncbi:MAG: gliding motility-associated C-terminal domain-containing protein [Saprospiraceae bacterium]|nr:gliding motility-associated C-terminal domain-containing protein [Saprospiraceae bacterium]